MRSLVAVAVLCLLALGFFPSMARGETGIASVYCCKFHGRKTASGQTYNQWAMTAAHKTLRFGTKVRVVNLRNGKSAVVVINDRGPFIKGRIIDLSVSASNAIGMGYGLAKVRLEIVGCVPRLGGSALVQC